MIRENQLKLVKILYNARDIITREKLAKEILDDKYPIKIDGDVVIEVLYSDIKNK